MNTAGSTAMRFYIRTRTRSGSARISQDRSPNTFTSGANKRRSTLARPQSRLALAGKTSRGYVVHGRNNQALTEDLIVRSLDMARDAWSCSLDSKRILAIGPMLRYDSLMSGEDIVLVRPTGENEVGFAEIRGQPGTVAVTVVWGVFSGDERFREISEFKMIFDQKHFRFGNSSESPTAPIIDLPATATHEWGHALGLDDIYDAHCTSVTMFGTSSVGETNKRSLETDDKLGVSSLYEQN